MLRRFLIAFFFVMLLGAVASFAGYRYLERIRDERELAARLLKKQDIQVTIIEGKRREEIAIQLDLAGICSAADFLGASRSLEGRLFPDTYRFFPNTPADEVVAKMTAEFQSKTAGLGLTSNDIILASIIEREAANDDQRALIAGVYTNRLKRGMRLEADPTVQYAKDSSTLLSDDIDSTFKFWQPITQAEYQKVVSPYNTYTVVGLPPGPIANPGLKSLQAAHSPASHDYYFFINKNGQLLLSKTLAEHQSKQ